MYLYYSVPAVSAQVLMPGAILSVQMLSVPVMWKVQVVLPGTLLLQLLPLLQVQTLAVPVPQKVQVLLPGTMLQLLPLLQVQTLAVPVLQKA